MDPVTLVFIGIVALLVTSAAMHPRTMTEVFSALGIVSWALWGLAVTNVEFFCNASGCPYTRSYHALSVIAIGFIVLNLYLLIKGSLSVLKPENAGESAVLGDGGRR